MMILNSFYFWDFLGYTVFRKMAIESIVYFLGQFEQIKIVNFSLIVNLFDLLLREVDAVDYMSIKAEARYLSFILRIIVYSVTIEVGLWMKHLLDSNFMHIFGPIILLRELFEELIRRIYSLHTNLVIFQIFLIKPQFIKIFLFLDLF